MAVNTFHPISDLPPVALLDFWEFAVVESNNRCWEWLGTMIDGYACHRGLLAHRIAYYLMHENLPVDGLVIQTCGNNSCVNPHHLRLITANGLMPPLFQFNRLFSDCRKAGRPL